MYITVGTFREPVKTENLAEDGHGIFFLTSRNAYFWSPQKKIKLPIKEIVSVFPDSDGIQQTASRNGRSPSLRSTSRMVAPAPDTESHLC